MAMGYAVMQFLGSAGYMYMAKYMSITWLVVVDAVLYQSVLASGLIGKATQKFTPSL